MPDSDPSADPPGDDPVLGAGELFEAHGSFVARFLWKMGCPEPEMDDAVQEVFLVAHQRGGYRPGPARPTTWLAEIALRTFRARRRKLGRRQLFEHRDLHAVEQKDESPNPERRSSARQELNLVHLALQKVSEERRSIVILADVEGLPNDEIAASLSLPLGTVYSRLSRGRKQFREAFRRLQHQQGKGTS